MIEKYIISDAGSVKLINWAGGSFCVSHGGGDGVFKVVLCSHEEVEHLNLKYLDSWLSDGSGWRVMQYDCVPSYANAYAFDLEGRYYSIMRDRYYNVYFVY